MVPDNFKSESFKKPLQQTEKVHYKGELRIIGQVVNNLSDTEPIGYVVMTEKTQQFKMYTVAQTKSLIQRFKFVNAAIENNKIVNTECAMTRLPKFNTKMSVIGNFGIIILGEIIDGDKKLGYRAMDTNARIVDIDEAEVIRLHGNGIDIINAKIVSRNNREIVSAIKTEFTKIEKSKLADMRKANKLSEKTLLRHKQHLDKMLKYTYPRMIRVFCKTGTANITELWCSKALIQDGSCTSYVDVQRELKIAVTEAFTEKNGYRLSKEDINLMQKIIKTLPYQNKLKSKHLADKETKFALLAISQFTLYNDVNYRQMVRYLSKTPLKMQAITSFINSGYASTRFKTLIQDINKLKADNKLVNRDLRQGRISEFKTTTFTSSEDVAQLGFALSPENANIKYVTKTNSHKKLLYLGDFITYNYFELKSMSRCLGDLASIAYIEKLISKYGDLTNPEGYAEHYGMLKEDIRAAIEIIITISYMFGSKAMKTYVEENIKDKLDTLKIEVPDFDELSSTDYQLPKEITLYYASGFNVFLSDNEEYNYKYIHLAKAKLINYRQIGIKHDIKHPLLQNELAPVVSMLTSYNCDADKVTELIGKIRFL